MNLGFTEILIVFLLALLLFGPKKLPEIGRTLGRAMAEFRRATNELKNTIEREIDMDGVKENISDIRQDLQEMRSDLESPVREIIDNVKGIGNLKDVRSSLENPIREAINNVKDIDLGKDLKG